MAVRDATDHSFSVRLKLFASAKLSRLRRLAVGRGARAILLETQNGKILVDPEDMGVGRVLSTQGSYGLDEVERLAKYITPQSIVLVVGSHVGSLVIPFSRLCRSVTAIEANPANYELLTMNLALNECRNVTAVPIAASDRVEELEFVASRANSGGSKRLPKVQNYIYFSDSPQVIKVKAAPLDDVLAGKRFDVLLVDIEGSEYFALRGMKRILSEAQVLCVEYLPHHLKNVAGVKPADFVAQIEPHFDHLLIPGTGRTAERKDFLTLLQEMYDREQGDDGIIFTKAQATQ